MRHYFLSFSDTVYKKFDLSTGPISTRFPQEDNTMDSPNWMDIELQLAGASLNLRMGSEEYHSRKLWRAARHCNADYEIHILLAGSCVLEVGHQDIHFSATKAILIAPGTFHCPHNLSEDFEWFCFSFMPTNQGFSQQLFDQIRTAAICTLPPEALAICRLIWEEVSDPQPFREDFVRALFTQLLVILFRRAHLEFSEHAVPVNTATWRTTIIDKFFSPWPNAFGTEDELAAMLNLSRRQLNRVLIQNYGMGYRQKMLRSRMEYAGNLLRTTDQKIGQIGIQVGYTAETSFYKAFQSYYNMTPQQYRHAQKGKLPK